MCADHAHARTINHLNALQEIEFGGRLEGKWAAKETHVSCFLKTPLFVACKF